jgi:26S proteasome regulatory subunit N9
VVGPANEFYSAALMFLSYTPVEELPSDDRYSLATDMALASVTGETIFNFGEVLATPILTYLQNTPNEWLLRLVEAMNSGNVEQFNSVVENYREPYLAQPALANSHDKVVKPKIVLLCLVNIVFQRHSHDRVIKFTDIAERASIPVDQVRTLCCTCFMFRTPCYRRATSSALSTLSES